MKRNILFLSLIALLFSSSALAQDNATEITTGSYYRMYVPNSKANLYVNGNYLQNAQTTEGDNTDVLKFEESTTGQYTIKSVANGKYLGDFANSKFYNLSNSWLTISDDSQTWQVKHYDSSTTYSNAWIIGKPGIAETEDGWMNYNLQKNGHGALLSYYVVGGSGEDKNSYFYLYPLTEYTVEITGVSGNSSVDITVADGDSRKSTTINGKVYLENTPSESTTCTASTGYVVKSVSVSGTTITVSLSDGQDKNIYFIPGAKEKMAIKYGNYYITQKNKANGIYYADFLDSNLRTPTGHTSKDGDDLPNLNWSFTIEPVDAADASKGVRITTDNGYLCSGGYVKEGSEADVIYFVKESNEATSFAITSDKTNYWTGSFGWDATNNVNYIKTSTTPDYSFTLEDVVLRYYDATTDGDYSFETEDQNICAVISRVCDKDSYYTMCLPFEISSVETTFGAGSKAATLEAFDNNTFKFKSSAAIPANTPFIFKPGFATVAVPLSQQKGRYTAYGVNGTKQENGKAMSTVSGATFTGVYKSGNVPQDSYFIGKGNTFNHAGDNTNTIKPFRAYLTVTNADGTLSAKSIGFEIDGSTTGISFVNDEPVNLKNGVIMDLCGRRVKNPTNGIYIINNKKVIFK